MGNKEGQTNVSRLTPIKRQLVNHLLDKIFPTYSQNQNPETISTEFQRFIEKGFGFVCFTTHFSKSDFLHLATLLMMENKDFRKLQMVFPLALHQVNQPFLKILMKVANFTVCPIVTEDTIKKENELLTAGKPIPWQRHNLGYGNVNYIRESLRVLKNGGIAFVSPHAQRINSLKQWYGQPVNGLDKVIHDRNLNVAYFFAALSTPNNNYAIDGYRVREPYGIRWTSPFPASDFREFAATQGGLDKAAYDILYRISPPTYRP